MFKTSISKKRKAQCRDAALRGNAEYLKCLARQPFALWVKDPLCNPQIIKIKKGSPGNGVFRVGAINGLRVIEKNYDKHWLPRIHLIDQVGASFNRAGLICPRVVHMRKYHGYIMVYYSWIDFEARKRLSCEQARCVIRNIQLSDVPNAAKKLSVQCDAKYTQYKKRLIQVCEFADIANAETIDHAESIITHESPRVLAHGDFGSTNVNANGAVVDLDNCGYFPPSYDFVFYLWREGVVNSVVELMEHVNSYWADVSRYYECKNLYMLECAYFSMIHTFARIEYRRWHNDHGRAKDEHADLLINLAAMLASERGEYSKTRQVLSSAVMTRT